MVDANDVSITAEKHVIRNPLFAEPEEKLMRAGSSPAGPTWILD